MSNGLLDYIQDFDVNKALGVQYGLPKGMLSPEIESQMGVGGTVTGVSNVIEGMQQGASTPENIFRFLTGQRAGRQNVINTATKNYLNQLNIAKLQGDIAQDPYKLAKLKFEVERAPYDIGKLQNEFYQSSFKTQGIKDEMKKLQDEGKIDELNTLLANPNKYFELKQSTDINKMDYKQPELSAARILNLDVRNRKNWNEQDEINYNAIISAPSQQEAARLNAEALARHKADPNRVPYVYTPSRNEVIAQIRKQNKGVTTVSSNGAEKIVEPTFTRVEKQSLPVGQFEPTKDYPEGGYKGADGKVYSMEKWNKLGLQQKQILGSDIDFKTYNEYNKKLFEDMKKDRGLAQYGYEMANRTNKAIERLLDEPDKVGKIFTFLGRGTIKFNEATGNFFATKSEAQDAVNQLNTIAGQQFTNEIQKMRANNQTGGAVGNVSDREVEMFKNMAASLRYSGTPEELYYQLNLLYGQGKRTIDTYRDNFELYYGENNLKQFNVDRYKYDMKEYGSYQDEISKKQGDQAAKVFGVPRKEEQQQFENNDGFKLRGVR